MEIPCTDCGGVASVSLGDVHIVVVNTYWKDGWLYAESLLVNATGSAKTNLYVKELTISTNAGIIASDGFNTLPSNTLQKYSYMYVTFEFPSAAVSNPNADLSHGVSWKSDVRFS